MNETRDAVDDVSGVGCTVAKAFTDFDGYVLIIQQNVCSRGLNLIGALYRAVPPAVTGGGPRPGWRPGRVAATR